MGTGMDETISAADANREFSRMLRGVRAGNSYVVTSHGRPVAKLVPVSHARQEREPARNRLLARLKSQPVMDIGSWDRDDLYDRD
jgi:prevent-host-death family protein